MEAAAAMFIGRSDSEYVFGMAVTSRAESTPSDAFKGAMRNLDLPTLWRPMSTNDNKDRSADTGLLSQIHAAPKTCLVVRLKSFKTLDLWLAVVETARTAV